MGAECLNGVHEKRQRWGGDDPLRDGHGLLSTAIHVALRIAQREGTPHQRNENLPLVSPKARLTYPKNTQAMAHAPKHPFNYANRVQRRCERKAATNCTAAGYMKTI